MELKQTLLTFVQIAKLAGRTFTTTSTRYAELPDSHATKVPSVQPVRKKPKIPLAGTFTTYTAYGMTETMYKECRSQAEYSMPQVEEDADLPQTEEGEDLGIGDSWWHTGKSS